MMTRVCPVCGKQQKNLHSHLTKTHKLDNSQRKYWISQEQVRKIDQRFTPYPQVQLVKDTKCQSFQLLHPFTAIVAGMTGSGKTVWVQNLLEHAIQVISPPPQRIVWSYAQWQPAYDHMLATIPGIEFVKGIPHEIDEDGFFDPQINNMIVIDDQMTETSNDKRVMNLFTKGSHHRNLSVIFLSQNLYFQGKIMCTVSLNAAYLFLFKNPRDKLQIMTLGKQMYPGRTEQFIQKYETAVKQPYGYLFVDLKPNTPEECRLRTNVLPDDQPVSKINPPTTVSQYGGQSDVTQSIANYFARQSYLQLPVLKTLQNLEEQMTGILSEPNLPTELKIKEYSQLYNRYLDLQQQIQIGSPYSSRLGTVQTPQIPPSASPSLSTSLTSPENVASTRLTTDSGYVTPKTKTPSFLERLTSKIRTPNLELGRAGASASVEIPSTSLRTTTSLEQPSAST